MLTGLAILLFFALVMSIISRLNSLSVQRDRVIQKINQANEEESKLKSQSKVTAKK